MLLDDVQSEPWDGVSTPPDALPTAKPSSTAPTTAQPSSRLPLNVFLLVAGQSMQALAMGGIALFLPLIRQDLGLTFTQAASLSGASTIVYALMQIPAGVLADRYGAKRPFLLGLLGTSLLTCSLAWVDQYPLLLLNQAASGFCRSLLFAPGLLLITSLFRPGRQATAMGLFIAGGISSNIVLNTFGPVLVGPFGWRIVFVSFAMTGILLVLLLGHFGPSGPAHGRGSVRLDGLLQLFRYRLMWAFAGIQFVRLAVVQAIGFWLPTFIVLEKHQSLETAGLLVAMGSLLSAPSNLLGGYIADRVKRPLVVIGASLTALAVTTVLLPAADLPLFVVVIAVNSVFLQFYFGPLFALPIEIFPGRPSGVMNGFGNFFANLGGFASVLLVGTIRDQTGSFDLGVYAIAGLCVLALAITVLVARSGYARAIDPTG